MNTRISSGHLFQNLSIGFNIINQQIEEKLLSLAYKVLSNIQPTTWNLSATLLLLPSLKQLRGRIAADIGLEYHKLLINVGSQINSGVLQQHSTIKVPFTY